MSRQNFLECGSSVDFSGIPDAVHSTITFGAYFMWERFSFSFILLFSKEKFFFGRLAQIEELTFRTALN